MKFIHSLSFKVLGGSLALLIILFGFYSYFAISFHNDQMMSHVLSSANRLSDVIKNSTHYSMLLNRKEDVYQIINTIGKEPGVEGIRIYNKRGTIMFSTRKTEEHTVVDMHAEACFVCHEQAKPIQSLPIDNRMRIYRSSEGPRVLGLINPIRNEPSCSNAECHAHPPDKTIIGVIDVRMSLAQVDADITRAEIKMVLYAVITVIVLVCMSLLLFYSKVHRPVKRLMIGTREISSGNLNYRIPIESKDEIGLLAFSFNEMTTSLHKVEEENQLWSDELEKRVKEKTDELRRIHEQILQIEKMASLGKLSATVAHELNNPLTGILTYAKLIAKRIKKDGSATEQTKQTLEELDLIAHESERCGNIVKNLLLFSRKQVGEFSLVHVEKIIMKAAQLVQHHFNISNVHFVLKNTAADGLLMCNENQIQQALIALFVNAVEAMPGGGTLAVEITQSYPELPLHIQLTDTGSGIAQEDLPHIFEPFFTTKKEGKGVGLGLSVVYGIIERHGGKVEINSSVGKGTRLVLTFLSPRAGSQQVDSEETSPSSEIYMDHNI